MTDCIICFEPCDKKPNNYTCKNDCFFNDSECCICDTCLDTWISYDEESAISKCPICAQHKLKDKNKKCEYHCSFNIGCHNIIYPEGVIFYKSERTRQTCRYILDLFTFILFLEVMGFILTNIWFWIVKYEQDEFNNEVKRGKWLEPSYYLITCPFASLLFLVSLVMCISIGKCLDNIC